jgi:SAM-dependent methyltransferase
MSDSDLYPGFFARFYDIIYDKVRSGADHDYFLHRILNAAGPVLEVGVGTGRFFLEALQRGADIHGVDISPAMVEVLRAKLPPQQQHRVEVADVCALNTAGNYALVIAPFRVFMHLLTVERQLQALAALHRQLIPGGTLIFDLFVPNLKMLSEGLRDQLDFEGEYEPGKMLRRYTSMNADPVNQLIQVAFRLEWEEDGIVRTETWHTRMRIFFRYELEHLMHRSVFPDYKIYGDFREQALDADSREFVVECFA